MDKKGENTSPKNEFPNITTSEADLERSSKRKPVDESAKSKRVKSPTRKDRLAVKDELSSRTLKRNSKNAVVFDEMLKSLDVMLGVAPITNSEPNNMDQIDTHSHGTLNLDSPPHKLYYREVDKSQESDLLSSRPIISPQLQLLGEVEQKSNLDEIERLETEKSRQLLEKFKLEKHAADKKELEMIAQEREKRSALDRGKRSKDARNTLEFALVSQVPVDESVFYC
jgi:hypothetical protein